MKLNDFFEKIKINKKIFFLIYLISITIISIFYASSKSQDEAFFVINFIMIFSALSAGIIILIFIGALIGISIFWVLQFLLLPLIFVMNYKNLEKLLTISIIIGVIISFWIFARFTVDDAFISWRYGKNLADFGIWNYSPNILDMTQAYTNPIYAILSIVPNYFNIDVVLFFKIVSLLNLFLFATYMIKKTGKYKTVLLFFILPATMIHLFSGLETFLFVSLLVVLFVNLYENNFKSSILITILLFLKKPET
mgnify:CR=1 FL=1